MRPQEFEWKKFERSPLYKNGNKLHEYQLEGLNWLTFCWYRRSVNNYIQKARSLTKNHTEAEFFWSLHSQLRTES